MGWKKRKLNTRIQHWEIKKTTTNEEKVKLFKQFFITEPEHKLFITEPEHKISNQENELIEMDILNDNNLETIKI